MFIPPGMTETEVLDAIERTVASLAASFTFGIWGLDDIKQEGRLEAVKLMNKQTYDPSRPLDNYLFTHLSRRFINLQRNKRFRNEPPCKGCHRGDFCCGEGVCQKYQEWLRRNTTKANVQSPLGLDHICDEKESRTRRESTVIQEAEASEIFELIDKELPVELRSAYLQMKTGVGVPKARREEVLKAIREMLACQNVES